MNISITFLILLFIFIGMKGKLGVVLYIFTLLAWFIIADFTLIGIFKALAILLLAGYIFKGYHKIENDNKARY